MKVQTAYSETFSGNTNRTDVAAPERHDAHPLKRAARHLAEVSSGKVRTREIVNLLLTHASRSRRASLPSTTTSLRVAGPTGRIAVQLRFR